eukprot:2476047-Lingulodinium_polyedra.AAC.1
MDHALRLVLRVAGDAQNIAVEERRATPHVHRHPVQEQTEVALVVRGRPHVDLRHAFPPVAQDVRHPGTQRVVVLRRDLAQAPADGL